MQKSAHLFHYKMQKDRLVAVEGAGATRRGGRAGGEGREQRSDVGSTADSEFEDSPRDAGRTRAGAPGEGNTVYEYPGLASGAGLELDNPAYRGPQPPALSPLASQSINNGQTPTAPARPP